MRAPRLLSHISSTCQGHGLCVRHCPRDAISLREGEPARVDPRACIGCRVCMRVCPTGAITMIERSTAEDA